MLEILVTPTYYSFLACEFVIDNKFVNPYVYVIYVESSMVAVTHLGRRMSEFFYIFFKRLSFV